MGSRYGDFTGKLLVHVIWKTGHGEELVAYKRWLQVEVPLKW